MTLPVHFVVELRYVLDFTTPLYLRLVTLQAYVRTPCNIPRYMSANKVLQQCTSKVRLNIQYESTYSTPVFEFNTTMALVVLMERCNFVTAATETEAMGHSTL